tara:strand:- start:3415 stop:3816 length:402 start_codon:yes stop_codon:yes gene_type:complete
MAVQGTSRAFKDISFSFSPHPVTKDLPVLTNERAIARAVRNLVETIPTERFFNPLIGTNVRGSLFQPYSRETLTTIEDQIRDTITNFEPRVGNVQIEASSQPDDNTFSVKVIFDIVGLAAPTQTFSFLLEPTR